MKKGIQKTTIFHSQVNQKLRKKGTKACLCVYASFALLYFGGGRFKTHSYKYKEWIDEQEFQFVFCYFE